MHARRLVSVHWVQWEWIRNEGRKTNAPATIGEAGRKVLCCDKQNTFISEMVVPFSVWMASFAARSPSGVGGKCTKPQHRGSCSKGRFRRESKGKADGQLYQEMSDTEHTEWPRNRNKGSFRNDYPSELRMLSQAEEKGEIPRRFIKRNTRERKREGTL